MAGKIIPFRRKIEKPHSISDEGVYFFETMTTGWAVGGQHLTHTEVADRCCELTGHSGQLIFDGEDLFWEAS